MEEILLFIFIGVFISILLFVILYIPNRKKVENISKIADGYLAQVNNDVNLSKKNVIDEKTKVYSDLVLFYEENQNTLTRHQGIQFLDKLDKIRKKNPKLKEIFKDL